MATAGSIIDSGALKVGLQSLTAAQSATALGTLNNLLSFWSVDGGDHVVTSESFSIGTSAAEYTIGSGGDKDTVRPLSVEQCYLRDGDGYDFPVRVMSAGQYNDIIDKDLSARPTKLYFNPEFPLAKIIFNSVPDAGYTAYFEFMKPFTALASTTTTLDNSWPGEYLEALVYNLAVAMGEDWDRVIPLTVKERAETTRTVIDRFNASNRPVPTSRFEFGAGGRYNINTDEWGR